MGCSKPHLPFRHPSVYDSLYPDPKDIPVAKYKVLDASQPPIAYYETGLAQNPYVPLPDAYAGRLRRDYYAAISWMDAQLSRVVNELYNQGLANDTLIVFHGDHGEQRHIISPRPNNIVTSSHYIVTYRYSADVTAFSPLSLFPQAGPWVSTGSGRSSLILSTARACRSSSPRLGYPDLRGHARWLWRHWWTFFPPWRHWQAYRYQSRMAWRARI